MYDFFYSDNFKRDMKELDASTLVVLQKILEKIFENPLRFKRLKGKSDLRKARFLCYRIVFSLKGNTVMLLSVRKRDQVYRQITGG